jgi:hypothetical protein
MMRDTGDRGLDPDLAARLSKLPLPGQRWLKTALITITDFDDSRYAAARPETTPAPQPEPEAPRRAPADLEDVISGRAKLEEQLEAYPELADELEGLSDVIDLLREAGRARRRKGEDVLRELGLVPPPEEETESESREEDAP